MSSRTDVREKTVSIIKQLLEENGVTPGEIKDKDRIVDDLGFTSLQVATLISLLETEFEVDPFMDGSTSIADIRTLGELCKAYQDALEK